MLTKKSIELELEKYHFHVLELKMVAEDCTLTTPQTVQDALNLAFQARSIQKRLDEKRKEIIDPARSFVAKVNLETSKFIDILSTITESLVQKIDTWKKDMSMFPIDGEPSYKTAHYTLCEKKDFEIVIEDISKIPIEFMQPNEQLIKSAAKAGMREIPGVRIERVSKSYLKSNVA